MRPSPSPSPSIKKENVQFDVLLERFNPYKLSNGMTVNVKTVLGQVNQMDGRIVDGAPLYNIAAQPVFNVDNTNRSYR